MKRQKIKNDPLPKYHVFFVLWIFLQIFAVMLTREERQLKKFLDEKVKTFNCTGFIQNDPVSIPHLFTRKQDIEIAGFFAAIFAWGNRTTIINKSRELVQLMEMQPYEFVLHYGKREMVQLHKFKHRTFCYDDLLFFTEFFHRHYTLHESLETAFTQWMQPGDKTVENALNGFRHYFFNSEHLKRTEKHIASPKQKSACKRINMFLRWMVREDNCGVDFGLWKNIQPAQLVCPLDLHVSNVARHLGLLERKQDDWLSALELTEALRRFDPHDPVKYDFALFGMGVNEKVR